MEIRNLQVLLIDDQEDTSITISLMLRSLGVEHIFIKKDGREGLEFIDNAKAVIDIILCDWNMPRMSGAELLRQVRSTGNKVPFLIMTGRNDIASVKEAKESGVTAYLHKPFTADELLKKLHATLELS